MEKIFTTIFLILINLFYEIKIFIAAILNKITAVVCKAVVCFVTMLHDKDYRLKISSLSDHPPAA